MREVLQEIEGIYHSITSQKNEPRHFFIPYLRSVAHHLFFADSPNRLPEIRLNLAELWERFNSESCHEFAFDLLSWAYEHDEKAMLVAAEGFICQPLSETKETREILMKGIWDTTKSLLLRRLFLKAFLFTFSDRRLVKEMIGRKPLIIKYAEVKEKCREVALYNLPSMTREAPETNVFENIENLYRSITTTMGNNEKAFLSTCFEEIAEEMLRSSYDGLQHGFSASRLNALALWDNFNPDSYERFTIDLLNMAYQQDENDLVSNVWGHLLSALPETEEAKQILIKGIWDRNKSNHLRDCFFSLLSFHYNGETEKFYLIELERFIQENSGNEHLVSEIIDYITWNKDCIKALENCRTLGTAYAEAHPGVKEDILFCLDVDSTIRDSSK